MVNGECECQVVSPFYGSFDGDNLSKQKACKQKWVPLVLHGGSNGPTLLTDCSTS
jgi:hypothetical protein